MRENDEAFQQNTIALIYDFDGTLIPGAMQQYGVLPKLGVEPSDFWGEVRRKRIEEGSEELLVYMRDMIDIADTKRVKLDKDSFIQHGKSIEFFDGVLGWFERINSYVSDISKLSEITVEHYIISSGLKEMIEGCEIARQFKEIYACEFHYDQYGHPKWPKRIISDSAKTQYLFRINKGVLDVNESINSHMRNEDRRIPFDNMMYFGDGDTDVPSMAVMMKNGGHAVAVHKPDEDDKKCIDLKKAERIDFFCPADYSEGSKLDNIVKNTLDVIVSRINLREKIHNLPPRGRL